jgi:hypothetical protein
VVNVPEVVEYVRQLPGVAYAEHNLYTCSQDTQERIANQIREHGLNRVVVASCTPRTHEPLFQDTLRQAGLNPYLFEMANIREQDSCPSRAPEIATQKPRSCHGGRQAAPASCTMFDRPSGLVIGGLAGMTAAVHHTGYEAYHRRQQAGRNRHIQTAGETTVAARSIQAGIRAAHPGADRVGAGIGSTVSSGWSVIEPESWSHLVATGARKSAAGIYTTSTSADSAPLESG